MDPPTNSLSTGGTQQGKDNEYFETRSEAELFDLVFRNDLIGNKISSYLNLADLKDASASCRALYGMVRNSTNCKETVKLCLNLQGRGQFDFSTGMVTYVDNEQEENLASSSSETTTMDKFLGFGVIEVDIVMSKKILKLLQENSNFLKNVHTVSVIDTWRDGKVAEADAMLNYIFSNTSVVTLQIDRDVELRSKLKDPFSTQAGTEYFSKLRNLEFLSKQGYELNLPIVDENIKYFSTLPLKLQRLVIAKVGSNFEPYGNIVDLILANSGSIQELILDFKETWAIKQFGNIRLPLLKKFSTSLTDVKEEIENFAIFMKNQPLLEELSLCVLKKCDQSLLTLIQERASKLKKLHLGAKHFGDMENAVNWGFLANMKNLKDFALVRPKSNGRINLTLHREGTGVSFLRALPTSLKHLKLRGIANFWWDSDQNTEIGELEKQSLVNRFPNLVTLSIIHYEGQGFNEDFLDKANSSMPKLQKLELSNIAKTIRFALALDQRAPVNLGNLKGLTNITIKGWGGISELLGSISHQFLRTLTLVTDERGVTGWDTNLAIQFVQQNPNLEKISISGDDLFRRPDLVNELKAKSSRLVQVEWSTTAVMDVLPEDSDSDSDPEQHIFFDNDNRNDYDYDDYHYDSYGEAPDDFTACDQDCGYCGNCDY